MHSIERYGIVALLFLVVTVVAVLMWDGNRSAKPTDEVRAAKRTPVPEERARPRATDPDRRLSLRVEGEPRPLRRPAAGNAPAGDEAWSRPAAGDEPAFLDEPVGEGFQAGSGGSVELPGRDARAREAHLRDSDQRQSRPLEATREPEAAPRRPAEAQRASGRTYQVRPGDTLSEIAQRELGSARRWPDIVAANEGLDPNKLRSGTTIRLPGDARPAASASAPAARTEPEAPRKAAAGTRTWTVQKNENLWRIAEKTLGDGGRWKEIVAVNPGMNPDRLLLGQVLKLPEGASAQAGQESKPQKSSGTDKGLVASSRGAANGGKVR